MNYYEITYQFTHLQYNDRVAKVHEYVCRPERIHNIKISMPPGDLTVIGLIIGRPGSVGRLDGGSPVAGQRQCGIRTILR